MTRQLTRIWLNHRSFDEAVKSGDGKYLTIISTTSRNIPSCNVTGTINKVGIINDYCESYEVVEAESGSNWKEFAELKYDNGCIHVIPKNEWFSMNLPVVLR